ncbi:D-hexose-6-phosphate mutarotase [Oceaniserpentilla sp. 4NH20-0058]|uniref:D-hexose-6-phosphate mutarotase n=1 Tax=Oceaniserpentilla sp. 4NH20-0058 TaxID=3127660 RepID=UPI0031070084
MPLIENKSFSSIIKHDELDCLHINHPDFFAEICLQGAQLTQFKHRLQGDFLWLSPTVQYKQGQSLRGGVPICWPWFGILDKNPSSVTDCVNGPQGSHGFARNQCWELSNITETQDSVMIELTLKHSQQSLAVWPFKFELTCRFTFSEKLTIELITQNLDEKVFTISQALHTYFPVDDISTVSIHGADSHKYVDALDDWQIKHQQQAIQFNQEVDRIYLGNIEYKFKSEHECFELNSNSHSSVVWNPWINKSKTLSQFPDDAYQSMLCIENANVLDDVITVKPNQTHTLSMTLIKR